MEKRKTERRRDRERDRERYYKELTHITTEAKCQDLQSVNCRPRELVQFQPESEGLRTERANVSTSVIQAHQLETKGKPRFQFKSKAKKRPRSQIPQSDGKSTLLAKRRPAFLFYSGLQLIGWGPFTIGRAISFNHCTTLNVNLIQKHTQRCTQNNV